MYDIIIIGAGPAGLTACLFAERQCLNVLIFDNIESPSNLSTAYDIENYPGIEHISGKELLEKMKKQIEDGCDIRNEKVIEIINTDKKKIIKTETDTYEAKSLIIATGLIHRKANIEGENKFLGRGVSYCTICDAPLFKNKDVVVIGGGDSAVKGALLLSEIANSVKLIHRRDELRAEKILYKKIMKDNVDILWNSVVQKINGDKFVSSIEVKNLKTKKTTKIKTDGVFIEIGFTPLSELMKNTGIKTDVNGFIIVDKEQRTNIDGIFAAGDVTNSPLKQVITACSDGAIAANSAYKYINR